MDRNEQTLHQNEQTLHRNEQTVHQNEQTLHRNEQTVHQNDQALSVLQSKIDATSKVCADTDSALTQFTVTLCTITGTLQLELSSEKLKTAQLQQELDLTTNHICVSKLAPEQAPSRLQSCLNDTKR